MIGLRDEKICKCDPRASRPAELLHQKNFRGVWQGASSQGDQGNEEKLWVKETQQDSVWSGCSRLRRVSRPPRELSSGREINCSASARRPTLLDPSMSWGCHPTSRPDPISSCLIPSRPVCPVPSYPQAATFPSTSSHVSTSNGHKREPQVC